MWPTSTTRLQVDYAIEKYNQINNDLVGRVALAYSISMYLAPFTSISPQITWIIPTSHLTFSITHFALRTILPPVKKSSEFELFVLVYCTLSLLYISLFFLFIYVTYIWENLIIKNIICFLFVIFMM